MPEKNPNGNKKKNENSENQSMSDASMETQGNRDTMGGDNMRGVSFTSTQTEDMNARTSNMQGSKKTNINTMEQDEQEDEDE
jgi:hypothetical protein